jgi:hypothetical protein
MKSRGRTMTPSEKMRANQIAALIKELTARQPCKFHKGYTVDPLTGECNWVTSRLPGIVYDEE